ncbi:MAG TPA: hypothetical protein VHQ47_03055 [Phycisphaerae bacterium]|nr:hypothetical protein [Phycisphaerae bacterium]
MTRRFRAHFANGVLVPHEKLELPADLELTVTVDSPEAQRPAVEMPRFDDPNDPMPEDGAALIDWWARHRLPVGPEIGDKIARSPGYDRFGEGEDDA